MVYCQAADKSILVVIKRGYSLFFICYNEQQVFSRGVGMSIFSRETKEEKRMKQAAAYEAILEKFHVPEKHTRVVISQSRVHNIYNCPAILWIEEDRVKALLFALNPKVVEYELEDLLFITSQPYVDFIRFDGSAYPDWARQTDYIKELFSPCVEMTRSKGGIDYKKQMYWIGTICLYAPSLAACLSMMGRPLSEYEMKIESMTRMKEDGAIPVELLTAESVAARSIQTSDSPQRNLSNTGTDISTEVNTITTGAMASVPRVLIVNGSPHREGSTYTALKELSDTLNSEGIETEIMQIGGEAIRGCTACGYCHREGQCIFDDIVREASKKLEMADGLVVGSPVYYASANGTLISFLDRLFYSSRFDKSLKVGAAVVSARRGGLSATFDELNKYFTISGMPVASGQYWNSIHGNNADEAKKDLEGMQSMRTLGLYMAFLIKSIRLGKEQIGVPVRESKVATNFIR